MINWKSKSPIELANRMVACDIIRTISSSKIQDIDDEKLRKAFLLPYEDDEGNKYSEIDWEFVLFYATEYQIGSLLEKFQPRQKNKKEEKKKSLLVNAHGKEI